jgi:SSS family solute:Na+ symporter
MIVPGMAAAVLYPALDSPDKVFPTLAFELLPIGFRGIVLAAMMAAIMSSLDSALNAAASLVTVDFVKPRWPDLGQRALIRIGRTVTAVIMMLAAIYAPLIASFGSLFEYFQATLAYLVPPVVAVYLGGIFSGWFTRESGFWALIVMQPAALALFLAKEITPLWSHLGLPALHFTYMAIALLCATLSVMAIISARAAEGRPRLDEAILAALGDVAPDTAASRLGLWRDYRVHGMVLMGTIGVLLALLA